MFEITLFCQMGSTDGHCGPRFIVVAANIRGAVGGGVHPNVGLDGPAVTQPFEFTLLKQEHALQEAEDRAKEKEAEAIRYMERS